MSDPFTKSWQDEAIQTGNQEASAIDEADAPKRFIPNLCNLTHITTGITSWIRRQVFCEDDEMRNVAFLLIVVIAGVIGLK